MEQSKVLSFFLLAPVKWESDVCCWGGTISPTHPSGCSLQLEALVHVRNMVTGRWTFHPPSVTGRQLQERRKKSSCETAFLKWTVAHVAMEMGTSCTSSVRACKRTSRYLRWSFVALSDSEGTPPSPPPLCLLTTVQFPAGISLWQLFSSISLRLRFPDAAGALGWRGGSVVEAFWLSCESLPFLWKAVEVGSQTKALSNGSASLVRLHNGEEGPKSQQIIHIGLFGLRAGMRDHKYGGWVNVVGYRGNTQPNRRWINATPNLVVYKATARLNHLCT